MSISTCVDKANRWLSPNRMQHTCARTSNQSHGPSDRRLNYFHTKTSVKEHEPAGTAAMPTPDPFGKRTRTRLCKLCPRATPCASARGCNCAHATSSARAIVLKPILNWKQDDTTCRNVTRSYFVWIRSINAKFCVHSSRFLITKKWNICLNF